MADIATAVVTWRAVAIGQDTGDPDTTPEEIPLEGVRVKLTPNPRKVELPATGSDPATTYTLREWDLTTGPDGVLVNPQDTANPTPIEIVASDAFPGLTVEWTSTIDAPDAGVPAIAKRFLAPTGATVDLTTVDSIPPGPSPLPAYLQAVADARAARDSAILAADRAETAEQGAGAARVGAEAARDEALPAATAATTAATAAQVARDEAVAAAKAVIVSPNLFDAATAILGHGIGSDGTPSEVPTRALSDFIPVEPSSQYILSHLGDPAPSPSVTYQRYDVSQNPVGSVSTTGTNPFTTTSLTRYIRVSPRLEQVDGLQLEQGDTATPFSPHGSVTVTGLRVPEIAPLESSITSLEARVAALEAIAPPSTRAPNGLLSWEETGHWGFLIATSFDGALHAFVQDVPGGGVWFQRSTDGGQTFERGFAVSTVSGTGNNPVAAFVFADGSVSVISSAGRMYHADAFDATPTLVHETGTGEPLHRLPSSAYSGPGGEKYVFAGEYSGTTTQKRVYYSTDGGLTWDTLKIGDTLNAGNNHWHASAYDPHTDSVWLSQGDGDNSRLYHSPDWGATWTHIPGTHPTVVHAFPGRVVFGRDKTGEPPGIDYWIPGSEPTPTTLRNGITFRTDRASFHYYPTRTNWNGGNGDDYYMLFPPRHEDETDGYIYATGDRGQTWHLLYNGPEVQAHLTGVDDAGYLYGMGTDGSRVQILRAKAPTWTEQ